MRKNIILALAVAGLLSAPLSAAEESAHMQEVTRMAADPSVSIEQLCRAVYEAAQADPESADQLLATVFDARANTMSSKELYMVLQTVMAAVPEIAQNFQREVQNYLNRGVHSEYGATDLSSVTARVVQVVFQTSSFQQTVPAARPDETPGAHTPSSDENLIPTPVSPQQ